LTGSEAEVQKRKGARGKQNEEKTNSLTASTVMMKRVITDGQ
jgi:hypothetical protein